MSARDERTGSAQDVTYRWLKRHIAGLPRDGGVFLTESEVAREAGTSRTPVREALLRLETEGLLRIVPKKGAYVPPISDAEVVAVMQARELVESWCVRRVTGAAEGTVPGAADGTVPGLAAELRGIVAEQRELLDDPVAFIDRDRAFHRAIVRAAGNPVLAEFYESLRERQIRMGLRAVANEADRVRVVLDEHTAIVDGIAAEDPARAAEAVTTHLGHTLAALRLPALSTLPALSSSTPLTAWNDIYENRVGR